MLQHRQSSWTQKSYICRKKPGAGVREIGGLEGETGGVFIEFDTPFESYLSVTLTPIYESEIGECICCPPCQVGRNGYGYIIPTLKGNLFYILSFTKVNSNADVSPGKERIGDLHSFNFIAHKLFITEFYFTSQVYIAQYDFK